MESLPEDIIIDILLKLPVKSISRFRCVCKHWYELFKNPKFIKMHHHHAIRNCKFNVLLASASSQSDNSFCYAIDFDITSSSYLKLVEINLPPVLVPADPTIFLWDGLVGLSTREQAESYRMISMICLWNPLTREYKKISIPTLVNKKTFDSRYGVCHDWKIGDYKLFRMVRNDNCCTEVWVYRFGSDSWKNVGNVPYPVIDLTGVPLKPLNGIIHWLQDDKFIFALDLLEERPSKIHIPGCYLDDEIYMFYDMEVGVLGEDLFLSVSPARLYHITACRKNNNFDLWVMKDYGVTDSWTKIFSFPKDKVDFGYLYPLHYLSKNNEILLHGTSFGPENDSDGFPRRKDSLVSYDPKTGALVALDIPCIPNEFSVSTFAGSLVSLNSGEFVRRNYANI